MKTTVALCALLTSFAAASLKQQPIQDASSELYHIETSPGETRWVTEEEKWALRRDGQNFMDITETPELSYHASLSSKPKAAVVFPDKPQFQDEIVPLFKKLSDSHMRKNLEKFSSFYTRYYKSSYGKESAEWLRQQINQTISDANADKNGARVEEFPHPWGQPSLIATIPGHTNKTVVIGAHQDSINLLLPSFLSAPGADDDGSGTVTILEALTGLLTSKNITKGRPKNTIEFHWYSAEEGGLLGSAALFSAYKSQKRDVKAMLQQDMTGYTQTTLDIGEKESVGVITDFVDAGLTQFIKKIIVEYCDIPYVLTKCGYACSDHASASNAGYPSAFVIESAFENSNKNIHGTGDTLDKLNFKHMLQHAKMTLALAYELAFADFD